MRNHRGRREFTLLGDHRVHAIGAKDPREFGVITVGAFQAGTVANIIPDQAVVRGTLRSYAPEVRSLLRDGVRRMATAAAAMSGAPEPEINIIEGVASVINDEGVIRRVDAALKSALGTDHVDIARPQTPSEDFSVYATQGVPSLTMRIGVYPPELIAAAALPGGKTLASNHSPYFAPVPEPSIKTGIKVTTSALLALMGKN